MNHFVKDIPLMVCQKAVDITQWVFNYKLQFSPLDENKPYIKNDPLYPFKKLLNSIKVPNIETFIKLD